MILKFDAVVAFHIGGCFFFVGGVGDMVGDFFVFGAHREWVFREVKPASRMFRKSDGILDG